MADLVRQHQAGVWRYLRFLGCDRPLADDLTQETFLAVLETPFDIRTPAQTAAYLRRVARNRMLMAFRKLGREPVVTDLDLAETLWSEMAGEDGLNNYLEALAECLETAVNGRAREAVMARYRDGASRDEIATRFDMAANGVKTMLRRTRNSLRDCVERKINR